MKRYDPAPFFSRAEAMGVSISELARRLRCDPVTLRRYREKGIPEDRADAYAFALGVMPHDLWDEWFADAIAEEERARRAKAAAKRRRQRRENPDYAERQRASARRYKAENKSYVLAQNRRYYRENRDRILAQLREKNRKEQAS